jgi:hypothetical protein
MAAARHGPVAVGHLGPRPRPQETTVTEADFSAIEAAIGRPLPDAYRRLMAGDPVDAPGSDAAIALLADAQSVVAINRELRRGEFAGEWRPEWFIVGNSPAGDLYALALSGASPAVLAWDHETHEVSVEAPDLGAFAGRLRRGGSDGGLP